MVEHPPGSILHSIELPLGSGAFSRVELLMTMDLKFVVGLQQLLP